MGLTVCGAEPKRLSYQHDALDAPNEQSDLLTLDDVRRRAAEGGLRLAGVGEDADGNLVASATDVPGVHMPVIDLDCPHRLVPSSTEGHSHLYLDVPMSTVQYKKLIETLVEVGLLGEGNLRQFQAHGQTFVRKPHVKKGAPA